MSLRNATPVYPITPCFGDDAARVAWERSLPTIVLAYYQAFSSVFSSESGGACSNPGHAGGCVVDGRGGETPGFVGLVGSAGGMGRICVADGDSVGYDVCGVGAASSDSGNGGGERRGEPGAISVELGVDSGVAGVQSCVRGGDVRGESVVDQSVPVASSAGVRGKRYAENKKRRERRKERKIQGVGVAGVPEWRRGAAPVGSCETVVSQQSCPSYGQALSDAEREAKESLARRRAAENAVAEKLAKMKLESLEDEQKCHEYAELKRQRVIQWTNEATAKSQQSLEKCKSIDPSSSASQYEIRKQAKALADLREEHAVLLKVFSERVPDHRKILDMLKPVSSESMDRYALEGMDAAVSVPDYADSMYDVHLTH